MYIYTVGETVFSEGTCGIHKDEALCETESERSSSGVARNFQREGRSFGSSVLTWVQYTSARMSKSAHGQLDASAQLDRSAQKSCPNRPTQKPIIMIDPNLCEY